MLILKHRKLAFYIFFLDIMFIAILYGFSFISTSILPDDPQIYLNITNQFQAALAISILVAVAYILIMVFIYSFFKYGVLDMIHSMIRNTDFDFGKMWKFYKLNIAIFGLPMVAFALFYVITLLTLRQEIQATISLIFLLIIAFFVYPFYNIAHSLFTRNYKIKKILKLSFRLTFKKFKSYLSIYFFSLLILGFFLLIFYLIGLIIGATVFSDPVVLSRYRSVYLTVFTLLLGIILYKIVFFNRVYFYVITETLINKLK